MDYKNLATELRQTVIQMTHKAGSSHIGSNFSSADLCAVLYDIADLEKDIVLVKPWNVANVYACLVRKGLLPKEAVEEYGKEGTPWSTIAEPIPPYIPFGCGAMGYNLPAAVGFALAKKLKKEEGTVYCLISDGELNIGSTWEAAQIANHHQLDNLIVIVDKNGFQAMGKTEDIIKVDPRRAFLSFNWTVDEIDGHDHAEIKRAIFDDFDPNKSRLIGPTVIIANTIKGKGWKRAEGDNLWHYSHVNDEMLEEALNELK